MRPPVPSGWPSRKVVLHGAHGMGWAERRRGTAPMNQDTSRLRICSPRAGRQQGPRRGAAPGPGCQTLSWDGQGRDNGFVRAGMGVAVLGHPPHPQPHLFHSPTTVPAAKPTPSARPKAFSGISVASLWSGIKPCLQGSSFFPQGKITECFQSAMELQKGITRPEPAEMSPERVSNRRPPHLGSGELPHHQLLHCSSRSLSPESRDPCSC